MAKPIRVKTKTIEEVVKEAREAPLLSAEAREENIKFLEEILGLGVAALLVPPGKEDDEG